MHKLEAKDYGQIRPLLDELIHYNISIESVLAGYNPGTVYVDDPAVPQVVLLIGPEGACLAGESPSQLQVDALKSLVNDLMFKQDMELMWLVCTPTWADRLVDILPHPPLQQERQHYVCTTLSLDWRAQLPAGFAVHPITQSLLDRPGLDIPDHVHGWMRGNWGSVDDFLLRGFGYVTEDVSANRVVSWSLCDCAGDDACEIGIRTHPDYRRRGLAAITVAAAVEYAFTQGYHAVGWHCNTENTGSRRTALHVGFVHERDYVNHFCVRNEAVHWAEAGRLQEMRGDYRAAADFYIRAASITEQPDWGCYIPFYAACALARLGEYAAAWDWLRQAVEQGLDDIASLQASEALSPLKGAERWAVLLQSIEQKKGGD